MAEPILDVCDIPSGVHQMRSDRVAKDVDMATALREVCCDGVLMEQAIDLRSGYGRP